jgi:hypothetical protein
LSKIAPRTNPLVWEIETCDVVELGPCLAVTRNTYVRLAGFGVRYEKNVPFVLPLRTIVAVMSSTS